MSRLFLNTQRILLSCLCLFYPFFIFVDKDSHMVKTNITKPQNSYILSHSLAYINIQWEENVKLIQCTDFPGVMGDRWAMKIPHILKWVLKEMF